MIPEKPDRITFTPDDELWNDWHKYANGCKSNIDIVRSLLYIAKKHEEAPFGVSVNRSDKKTIFGVTGNHNK